METRKKSKPLMEKKRRARINSSLSELKSLLQDVIKEEGARHNKMEKADILEMTVRYLRRVQQQRCTGRPSTASKYRLGFNECISEIGKFLKTSDNVDPDMHAKVLDHLVNQSFEKDSTNENEDDILLSPFDVNNNNGNKPSPSKNHDRSESYGLGINAGGKATIVSPPVTSANENAQNFICTNQTQIPFQAYTTSQQHVPQVIQTVSQPNIVSGVQLIPTSSLVSGQVAFILPANPVQTGPVVNCVVANQPHIASQSSVINQQQMAKQTQSVECLSTTSSVSYNTPPQTFTPVTSPNLASCNNNSVALPIGNTMCQNRRTVINVPKPMSGDFDGEEKIMNYSLVAPKPIHDANSGFCKVHSPEVQNVWRPW